MVFAGAQCSTIAFPRAIEKLTYLPNAKNTRSIVDIWPGVRKIDDLLGRKLIAHLSWLHSETHPRLPLPACAQPTIHDKGVIRHLRLRVQISYLSEYALPEKSVVEMWLSNSVRTVVEFYGVAGYIFTSKCATSSKDFVTLFDWGPSKIGHIFTKITCFISEQNW